MRRYSMKPVTDRAIANDSATPCVGWDENPVFKQKLLLCKVVDQRSMRSVIERRRERARLRRWVLVSRGTNWSRMAPIMHEAQQRRVNKRQLHFPNPFPPRGYPIDM